MINKGRNLGISLGVCVVMGLFESGGCSDSKVKVLWGFSFKVNWRIKRVEE